MNHIEVSSDVVQIQCELRYLLNHPFIEVPRYYRVHVITKDSMVFGEPIH
jgi:hypothetical protein